MKQSQHGKRITRVADRFEAVDLGAPFKVFLNRAVQVTFDKGTGKQISYAIPDSEGLIQAIVISRVLHPRRLLGADLKFLRKSVELQQKELAEKMDLSAEYLSRCENDAVVMSPQTEKLIRIYLLKTAMKIHKIKSCEAKTRLEDALDSLFAGIKTVSVFDPSKPLELNFSRGREEPDDKWEQAAA